jgi:hypothetical protein
MGMAFLRDHHPSAGREVLMDAQVRARATLVEMGLSIRVIKATDVADPLPSAP